MRTSISRLIARNFQQFMPQPVTTSSAALNIAVKKVEIVKTKR